MAGRTTRRVTTGLCAVLFAFTSVHMATTLSADGAEPSASPQFPKATYTSLDADTTRIWFSPGNLYEQEPVEVRIGRDGEQRTEMVQRRDGVWVAEVATPEARTKHTFYFTVVARATAWGAWVKAKKVRP